MAEYSGFFDAHLVNNEYDRVYLAEHFAKYFASFIGNGIFAGKSNELVVKQKDKPDMSVKVLPGKGWINGYYYENDDDLTLTFDIADGVLNRIDAVILRWDNSERVIRATVKKGVPTNKPSVPTLQRDDDIYELKLAEVYIAAGVTNITQVAITDTRLNTEVCGLVHGVVEQLDASEFAAQLNDYVTNFIQDTDAWFLQYKSNCDTAVDNLLLSNQDKVDALLSSGREDINAAISDGNARLNKLLNDYNTEFSNALEGYEEIKTNSQTEINRLIAELEDVVDGTEVAEISTKVENILTQIGNLNSEITNIKSSLTSHSSSITSINQEIVTIKTEISTIKTNVSNLVSDLNKIKALFVESGPNPGCYYRVVNDENEWINPPNEVGISYRTTEKWNGKSVYQRLFYIGALPNKTVMGITADVVWDKIISIDGFALSDDDMYFYPFPIILNGLTPAAVITNAESDGGNGVTIVIQTNDDLSHLRGYIKIKYTKE